MSNIKINDVPQRIQYAATNGQTQFAIPFPFFENAYVIVWQDGVQLFQGAAPGQYGISGAGSPSGGQITLVTPATLDSIITIQGEMPIDRTSIYSATISNLTGSDLNGDFNREVVMMKQIQTTQEFLQLQYAPWALVSQDPTVTRDRYLPILAPQQVFRMNEAGTAFEGFTIDNTPSPSNAYYVTYGEDASLENEQNLALLGNGLLKQSVAGGFATLAIAIPGTDYLNPGTLGTMAFQDADDVNITGGFAGLTSGTVANAPVLAIDIVNKGYADAIAGGFTFKAAAYATTTTDLDATYNNGVSGVGATLTANNNGVLAMDGENPPLNSRVLVTDQIAAAQNGIYLVTDAGSVGTPFILTRTTDFDTNANIVPGSIVFIQEGSLYAETSFVETEPVVTVGTDPIRFVQFSQQYPLSMGNGGTGSAITPIANAVFSTNGSSIGQLSTTLPSGLTIPGYAHSGANSDITSMTGLTGKLRAPTSIASSTDLDVLSFSYTASAVNNFQVASSATGVPIALSAVGSDSNINVNLLTKGIGSFNLLSAHTTTPLSIYSGTGYQHITTFNMANTAATRNMTFPDASGTFALTDDLDWELITTATASGSSAVQAFTGLAGYRQICICYSNMGVATNTAQIGMLASINNGSSYLTAAGSYFWQVMSAVGGTLTGQNSTTATFMQLSSNISNLAGAGMFGMIWINNMTSTTSRKSWISKCCHFNSSTANIMYFDSVGEIITASAVNALEFATTGGNIATGEFAVYGIR